MFQSLRKSKHLQKNETGKHGIHYADATQLLQKFVQKKYSDTSTIPPCVEDVDSNNDKHHHIFYRTWTYSDLRIFCTPAESTQHIFLACYNAAQ